MRAPWAKPRHELLLLALCAAAVLSLVNVVNVQDRSRFCFSHALAHGRLTIDRCIGSGIDRSRHGGHLYTNKAPGMSVLALPAFVHGDSTLQKERQDADAQIWLARLLSCGLPYLLLLFLVGRVTEGLAAGTGGVAIVGLGLGTLVAPFGIVAFDHVPATAFVFLSFVLAWHRRPTAAGLAAGAAVLCEYETAPVVALIGGYVLWRDRRLVLRYVGGVLPGALLLGAYDWACFGALWRTPLAYSDNRYRDVHNGGLLGVHLPNAHSVREVLVGSGGLIVVSPVLVAGGAGLALLALRGRRAEALLCALVALVFLLAEAGYGDPYGGHSPGPRYLIPALPFLALGIGPAYRRWRYPTALLTLLSVIPTLVVTYTWEKHARWAGGVWRAIARVPLDRGSSEVATHLAPSVAGWAGVSALYAAALAFCCGLSALLLATREA